MLASRQSVAIEIKDKNMTIIDCLSSDMYSSAPHLPIHLTKPNGLHDVFNQLFDMLFFTYCDLDRKIQMNEELK